MTESGLSILIASIRYILCVYRLTYYPQGHLASQATTKITITWEARSAGAWDAEIFLAYNNTYSIINVSGKGAFHPVKSIIASAAPLSKAMRIRETKKARLSLVGSDHIGFDPIALGDSRKRSFQLSNETDVFMTFKVTLDMFV